DGYETGYEPPLPERQFSSWPGFFRREAVFGVSAAERLERWRTREAAVTVRPPTLTVAAADTLKPLLDDVTLVDATTDAWEAVRGQLARPQDAVQLVERWEVHP
ncbi:MAG: hypothetical protein HOV70_31720, partial [Streptomyces sp.]|nr:hypothetical protein [Streptomyces sp.]